MNTGVGNISAPLLAFQSKLKYFNIFNGIYLLWAVLSLIFYIIITVDLSSSCNSLQTYFIIWTCSYALQLFVPLTALIIVSQFKFYSFGYLLAGLALAYKVLVMASLGIGAWGKVGSCYIPSNYKTIIMITQALQILCLIVEIVLIWRIKSVNREMLVQRLIQSKTFAEN